MINSSEFVVEATQDLGDFYGWSILIGDDLTLDTSAKPQNGDFVLIGKSIQKFNKQLDICGVVIYVGRAKVSL